MLFKNKNYGRGNRSYLKIIWNDESLSVFKLSQVACCFRYFVDFALLSIGL